MVVLSDRIFSFVSRAMPADTFSVAHFEGTEGISRLYEFDITLVSENPRIDFEKVMDAQASLRFEIEEDRPLVFSGILSEFEQQQSVGPYTLFKATLVPRLWWLTQSVQNQVFLNQTTLQFIEAVLQQAGLTTLDYEFRLKGDYSKPWELVCQFRESHYSFISRWMEWEGMFFHFEPGDSGEKLVITDTNMEWAQATADVTLQYMDAFGLDTRPLDDVLSPWTCRQKKLPRNVQLKDYNYRRPSLGITGQADISDKGVGDIYLYGEHVQTPEEAGRLAQVRAEEHLCRRKRFFGQSRSPKVRSGRIMELDRHVREDFNTGYLIEEVNHRGHQIGFMTSGIKESWAELEKEPMYVNDIKAVSASVQYRPRRVTEKPRLYGTLNAKIDAAGSGQYAELDDQGRYKVILPFDLSGRKDGKASTWLRMAQPYTGSNHGMHFPLHKGTEVLLTFIDGDPDRPIISGAVPNPENPSTVHSGNATRAGFQTSGGGSLHFETRKGKERLVLHPGDGRSHMSLGKGSPAEHFLGSDSSVQFTTVGSGYFSGLLHTLHTYKSSATVTGFKKAQVLSFLLETFVASLPELVKASVEAGQQTHEGKSAGEAAESDKTQYAEGVMAIVMPVILLVQEWYYLDFIGKKVAQKFKDAGEINDYFLKKPAFFAGHLKDGSLTQLDKNGENIIFATDEGSIISFAKNDVVSTADNIKMTGDTSIEAETTLGTIKFHSGPEPIPEWNNYTEWTMKGGITQLKSVKGKTRKPDNTAITIEGHKLVFESCKKKATEKKTTFKIENDDHGPHQTFTSVSDTNTFTFESKFNANGAAVEFKVHQNAAGDGGLSFTSGADDLSVKLYSPKKLDLEGKNVTVAALDDQAKIELKEDGSIDVTAKGDINFKAPEDTSITFNGKVLKVNEVLVVKK